MYGIAKRDFGLDELAKARLGQDGEGDAQAHKAYGKCVRLALDRLKTFRDTLLQNPGEAKRLHYRSAMLRLREVRRQLKWADPNKAKQPPVPPSNFSHFCSMRRLHRQLSLCCDRIGWRWSRKTKRPRYLALLPSIDSLQYLVIAMARVLFYAGGHKKKRRRVWLMK
jgi:hypothetical protein